MIHLYSVASQSKTQISIAHSPDSDDAYMFYALNSGKIPYPYEFTFTSAEIETLNQAAVAKTAPDICALSFHAYAYVADQYQILRSGASMAGANYGPRLVAKDTLAKQICTRANLSNLRIAIPGKLTSAYLCLQIYQKQIGANFIPVFCKFDEVFDLLASGEVDASLLIHESQLKYQEQGCELILDLGKWWHEMSGGLSMPLGCNAINRKLPEHDRVELAKLMTESIRWGLEHRAETLAYARKFADNNLSDEKADEYISMYVNDQTLALSQDDVNSIKLMYKLATDFNLLPDKTTTLDLI